MAKCQFYTSQEVADLLGIHRMTLYGYLKEKDDFPKPLRLSSRCFKFRKAEVDAYLSSILDDDYDPNQEACYD